MNILITSCSKKVLLVKSFKTYLNNMGGLVYATDININAPALYFADDYFLCPRSNNPRFIDFLLNNCKKFNIKLIIPTSCRELKIFAENKKKFEDIGIKVMICSTESVEICQNKKKFVNFCLKNEIPVPKTYDNKKSVNIFPVFSKPITGSAGKGIQKINNKEDLDIINFNENLVQEFIDWKEYTIDYLSDFKGKYINCIPRERINVVNGESCVSQIYDNKKIKDLCKILGNKLKLIGHNTLQCFCNGNDIKFIEINPRFGGACNLGINAGLESPKILIDLLYNNKFNIIEPQNNLLILRYSSDIFGYIENNNFVPQLLKQKNKIYCIDIDGTLCTEMCEYKDAKPIVKVIKKINDLYDNNNKIILFTARGYTSKKDWRELTEKQLKEWNVKYHELIFEKPFADYYIDNKAINILEWI
jgi:carbamoyl-phosphate synthase large subunit